MLEYVSVQSSYAKREASVNYEMKVHLYLADSGIQTRNLEIHSQTRFRQFESGYADRLHVHL